MLFDQLPLTIFVGSIVGVVIFFGLTTFIAEPSTYYWLSILLIISFFRIAHLILWQKNRLYQSQKLHIYLALIGNFLGGLTWASLILFYSEELPLTLQLFIMITLVGMPAASLSSNSVYLPAFIAFSFPQVIAALYWAFFISPTLNIEFGLMSITYTTLLYVTARKLNRYLRENISTNLYNAILAQDLEKANKELSDLAYYDPLTGIHNRRYFVEQLEKQLTENNHKTYWILLFDLDKFKQINDNLGHHIGDIYLQEIAVRLKKFAAEQEEALFARLGGDEFILAYHNKLINDSADNENRLDRLLEIIQKPIKAESHTIEPSTSIGVAEFPIDGHKVKALLHAADQAMYAAKKQGGNHYFLYEADK